jgi:hypothetical protein
VDIAVDSTLTAPVIAAIEEAFSLGWIEYDECMYTNNKSTTTQLLILILV